MCNKLIVAYVILTLKPEEKNNESNPKTGNGKRT